MPMVIEKERFVSYWHKRGFTTEESVGVYTHTYYKKKGNGEGQSRGFSYKRGAQAKASEMEKMYVSGSRTRTFLTVRFIMNGPTVSPLRPPTARASAIPTPQTPTATTTGASPRTIAT